MRAHRRFKLSTVEAKKPRYGWESVLSCLFSKWKVKVGGQRMIPGDKLIFEGSSDSEWHFVSPKAPFTYAQLRKELKWLQGHFAALNLDERAPATAPGHAEARAWDARATALFCRNCDIIC